MLLHELMEKTTTLTEKQFIAQCPAPALVFLPLDATTKLKIEAGLITYNDEDTDVESVDIKIIHKGEGSKKKLSGIFDETSHQKFGTLRNKGYVIFLTKNSTNDGPAITIGRCSTNDILIEDPMISKVHAMFVQLKTSGSWTVLDNHSSNNTILNGSILKSRRPYVVQDGSKLVFANRITAFFYTPETLYKTISLIHQSLKARDIHHEKQTG